MKFFDGRLTRAAGPHAGAGVWRIYALGYSSFCWRPRGRGEVIVGVRELARVRRPDGRMTVILMIVIILVNLKLNSVLDSRAGLSQS